MTFILATAGKYHRVEADNVEAAMKKFVLEGGGPLGGFLCVWPADEDEEKMTVGLTEFVIEELAKLGKAAVRFSYRRAMEPVGQRAPRKVRVIDEVKKAGNLPKALVALIGIQHDRSYLHKVLGVVGSRDDRYQQYVRAIDMILTGKYSMATVTLETDVKIEITRKLLSKLDALTVSKTGKHILCGCFKPAIQHKGRGCTYRHALKKSGHDVKKETIDEQDEPRPAPSGVTKLQARPARRVEGGAPLERVTLQRTPAEWKKIEQEARTSGGRSYRGDGGQ